MTSYQMRSYFGLLLASDLYALLSQVAAKLFEQIFDTYMVKLQ